MVGGGDIMTVIPVVVMVGDGLYADYRQTIMDCSI